MTGLMRNTFEAPEYEVQTAKSWFSNIGAIERENCSVQSKSTIQSLPPVRIFQTPNAGGKSWNIQFGGTFVGIQFHKLRVVKLTAGIQGSPKKQSLFASPEPPEPTDSENAAQPRGRRDNT
jgi:hypothetical protein